jgi:hypothetical protein
VVEEDVWVVTEANHRSTPELIGLFLQAALELHDPQYYKGLMSMDVVGQVIGLEDRKRLLHIKRASGPRPLHGQDRDGRDRAVQVYARRLGGSTAAKVELSFGERMFCRQPATLPMLSERSWWRRMLGG